MNDRIEILNMITQIATIGMVFVTMFLLKEAIRNRKSTVKPIIHPSFDVEFDSTDKLFLFNFVYPIMEYAYHGTVYFGVKNIGKGPACNVKIESVEGTWDEIDFKIGGDNYANIPEGSSIPIIMRVGFTDTDFEYGNLSIKVSYEDVLGEKYYFSVNLWLRNIKREDGFIVTAIPVRYDNFRKSEKVEFYSVMFRAIENTGYYELDRIRDVLRSEKKR